MIGNIVREVAFQTTSGSDHNRDLGARLWILLPRILLASTKNEPGTQTRKEDGGGTVHQGAQIRIDVGRRIGKFMAGQWEKLLPPSVPHNTPSDEAPDPERQAAECIRNVRTGLIARGMAALNSAPLAPADDIAFEATKSTLKAHVADHRTPTSVSISSPESSRFRKLWLPT